MIKKKFSTYNDGVLLICSSIKPKTDFNAVQNVDQAEDLKKIYKLAFGEMSKRDEDINFADAQGRALNLKVKTRLVSGVKKTNRVLIGDTLYAIIKTDESRKKQELYLYLEEERKITNA